MQRQALASGGAPAILVEQFLEEVEPLLVMVEQEEAAAQPVAQLDFAQVADVELGGVGRQPPLGHVTGPEPHLGKGLVGAAIHHYGVIAHVHVAVIVDPALFYLVKAGQEGRGIGHGETFSRQRRVRSMGFHGTIAMVSARPVTHAQRFRDLDFGALLPDHRQAQSYGGYRGKPDRTAGVHCGGACGPRGSGGGGGSF